MPQARFRTSRRYPLAVCARRRGSILRSHGVLHATSSGMPLALFGIVAVLVARFATVGVHAGADALPRTTPEAVGLSSAALQRATGLLEQFVADRRIAGAVAAVARRGQLAYLQAVGVQDVESRAPM